VPGFVEAEMPGSRSPDAPVQRGSEPKRGGGVTGEPERGGRNRVGGLGTERVYPQTTGVTETADRLYIQSLHAHAIGWLPR